MLYGTTPAATFPGMLMMVFSVGTGDFPARITGKKIPSVWWVSLVAMVLTAPVCLWGAELKCYNKES
jgi:hypothetical protein